MIYAGILAGGTGTRMGIQDMPKQFLPLGNKPIIIHTVEKFLFVPNIDIVYVAVHPDWVSHFNDLLEKYIVTNKEKIRVVSGGGNRNDSILSIIADIKRGSDYSDKDVLITHDAVRPFVSYRMIVDNIEAMTTYDVADTVVMANDTIVESVDGKVISSIPNRTHMYQGQTPQTDACKVFVVNNVDVALVKGEYSNIKITTVTDLKIAQAMLGEI